jgi:cyclase
VASIDARRTESSWEVVTHGGRVGTGRDALEWASEVVARGAGEILLTSIDRDGTRDGYDLALTRAVAERVPVPVIASGGAGRAEDLVSAVRDGGADAVLIAGILHDGATTIAALKRSLAASGVPVRSAA